jgi:hypothetical protein
LPADGSFYIKDAPAIGHEGYSINEQLTAKAGAALSDSAKGYVTAAQATLMSSLMDKQRANICASSTSSMVKARTQIATLLRSLLTTTASAEKVVAWRCCMSEAEYSCARLVLVFEVANCGLIPVL